MRVRPMLGEYQLEGIESIESAERRALVEHRVPGMEGSYLQDLGSAPNAIVIAGTRHGDEARDAFLEEVRALFGTGEPTTFAADITTATDLTDVVIEDLQVAEVAGDPDSFRYVVRLRKYVEPPEPPAAGFPGLDDDLLGEAASMVEALDTLDALASTPNLGDPTPPLRGALDGVRGATSDLAPAAADADGGLSAAAATAESVPAPEELGESLAGVQGSAEEGTGAAGALAALSGADVPGQREDLVASLDASVAGAAPEGEAPGGDVAEQLGGAAAALPPAEEVSAPLAEPIETIRGLTGPEAAGAVPAAADSLARLNEEGPAASGEVLGEEAASLDRFEESALAGPFGDLAEWAEGIGELATALEADTADAVRERLFAFLSEHARELAAALVPGGGPVAGLSAALAGAAPPERLAAVSGAASDLAAALETVRTEAAAGRTPPAEPLAAAEAALDLLATEGPALAAALDEALRRPAATPEGLGQALAALHQGLRGIEVMDFADLPEAFAGAFGDIREAIAALPLDDAIAPAQAALEEVAGAVGQLDLGRLGENLDAAQAEVEAALGTLDGALLEVQAMVRAAFNTVREALASATAAFGTRDAEGRFHFHAEAEVEEVLESARDVIRDDIQPALTTFRTTVHDAVGEVTTALQGVTAEVEAAKEQLRAALETATAELEAVDVTATAQELAERLGSVLDGLGEIDFDAVVDPVVAQIGDMRDQLRRIDSSTLNDILRAALAAASMALEAIDFPSDITGVLMTELDELLTVPVEAIADLQERLDEAVSHFAALDPQVLVEPLRSVFDPAAAALDELRLDALAAPLTEWHAAARAAFDQVMPEALLAPLVEAYDELARVVGSVSPDAVAASLEEALAAARNDLDRLEPATLVASLTGEIGRARELVERLAPEAVLAPLTESHGRIADQIAGLDPGELLAPVERLRGVVDGPLAELTDADAERAAAELEPLRALARDADPALAFAAAADALGGVAERLAALDLETALATARTHRTEALTALAAAGAPAAAALARVEALDPLARPEVAQVLADLRRVRTAAAAFPAGAAPGAEAVAGWEEARPVVEALVPPWAQGTPTADGLRGAFTWADTSAVETELSAVHQEINAQWAALDPGRFVPALAAIHGEVTSALAAVDPEALAGRVDELVGGIAERLGTLDIGAIRTDATALQADVTGLVAGLDPRPAIERLSGLADDVRGLVDAIDPAALLAELEAPVAAAREILSAVDPAELAEALEPAFQRIRELLGDIDLSEALEPLTGRLDALRDELEAALRRTEQAFRGLLGAIPS